jgi:murein DD-endopeptidase MepM/ murein hydrolase activator NlpD
MQETRNATRRNRREVAETTRAVAARTAEQRAVRDRLAWSQRELATARRDKRATLANVREDKEDAIGHMRDLQAQSAAWRRRSALRRALRSCRRRPARLGRGFIWPVHGVLTSGFGWRWGGCTRASTSPSRTARPSSRRGRDGDRRRLAGGYGNLVVIDHGTAIATPTATTRASRSGSASRSRRAS